MKWLIGKIRFLFFLVAFLISSIILIGVAFGAGLLSLPDARQLEGCFTTSLYKVQLCPGSEDYVKLHDISPYVLHAVIAAEDGSFYSHKGFDWHEIRESLNANMSAGGFRRGGSTLTQQLAKNAFLGSEKSLWRKAKEAYLANAIEHRYDKNFILEKYLNVVEFGPNLFGIKGAARHYFQKKPSDLHPLEAAYLAMLLPNPKKYSQSSRAGKLTPYARKMVHVILQRMQAFGKLSAPAYQLAMGSIDAFPWSSLSLSAFSGSPGYSLDSDAQPPAFDEPVDTDEDDIGNIIQPDQNDRPAKGPSLKSLPPREDAEPNPTPSPSMERDEEQENPDSESDGVI